jgi:hypothetical protein
VVRVLERLLKVAVYAGNRPGFVVVPQRQSIVFALIDDLPSNGALAVECIGGEMVPFSDSISSSFGTAVISLDLASVAICASTRRCSQPQALTMCSADFSLARSKERRRTLPSIATTPRTVSAKRVMKCGNAAPNCVGSSWRNSRLKVS